MEELWEELSGFLRETNLARANHFKIEKTLRDAGSKIETIKHIEHIRWCRFHYYNHWKYGTERDTRRRTHPGLKSYDLLEPKERKKDDIYSTIVNQKLIEEMGK